MSAVDEKTSFWSGVKSLYAALPPQARGFLLAVMLFLLCTFTLWPLLKQTMCWEFRANEGRFFKFNVCSGEVVEITEQYLELKK